MALAIERVAEAIRCTVPVGVVVFDAWSLAEALVRIWARRRKDWLSRLHTNSLLATASVQLRDANGWAMKRPGPHLAVEERIPLIPAQAYRSVTVHEQTSGGFTLTVRIPSLGQVRLMGSCEPEALTGRSVVLVTNRQRFYLLVQAMAGASPFLASHSGVFLSQGQDTTSYLL
jgi:hypothetical protein